MSGTKPPYKVPSMREIEKIPWNGYKVVSTFSGGGGSCLGYRMAGYKILYANEFVEEAQNTYRANNPTTYLDTRDIREVTGDDILKQINMKKGEIDLFDGSPPCCAFSTAGRREKGWGKEREYSEGKVQRIEDLFFEYTRLIGDLQPKTFVAENVSGLVKGTAIGYFKLIYEELEKQGYNVKAKLLNAKYLGVPQSRERLIFVGVRKDLNMEPVHPKPLNYTYSLKDAIEDLANDPQNIAESNELQKELKDGGYKLYEMALKLPLNPPKPITGADYTPNGSWFNLKRECWTRPCSTICQMSGQVGMAGNFHPFYQRKFTIPELKRITSLPDDYILTGNYTQMWERCGRMVPPVMMMHISKTIQTEILDKLSGRNNA